ncbi:AI-2E family transporter [Plantibacter sp. YIM 135249]|jgi:predicted PurR-regulated permease PerM|uniref:AI-2E family transporter n=1 Tax=Plantibacter sp. YIM 135249 TaxID=3423918 RepID=UPI003D32661E
MAIEPRRNPRLRASSGTPRIQFRGGRPVARTETVKTILQQPFAVGFIGALGVLAAILLGVTLGSLSSILVYIAAALFIALGLDPVVVRLESHGVKRPLAIAIVFAVFALVIIGLLALIVPIVTRQAIELVQNAPLFLTDIKNQPWFVNLSDALGPGVDLEGALSWLQSLAADPKNWVALAGGVLSVGGGILNGFFGGFIVLVLSLYFLASMRAMKNAFYSLVSRRNRPRVISITNQITASIGGYVNGMVILAAINASLGLVMMLIVGVPFAGILAVVIFFVTLIPLVGSIIATVIVAIVALFNSPATALVVVIYYLIYMQVESYVLTPRVMNKAVAVPGALVVIGAMVGGALLGLLGALVSIPVTASILLIIKQVVVPRQDRKA